MDWRDYFTGGKKYDPAPEKPAGLPNIEKVPPMPLCKPPKSNFIQLGCIVVDKTTVKGFYISWEIRRIHVAGISGESSWMTDEMTPEEFEVTILEIENFCNIKLRKP